LRRRLDVVTLFTERLPVIAIPEQNVIAAMRHDVIDDARGLEYANVPAIRIDA
jgi:hypothetical protein